MDLNEKAAANNGTLTTNETLVDLYIERAIDLLRLEAGTRNKVLAILNDLEGELVGALAKVDPTGVGSVSAQQKRLAKLLDSVRGAIRASVPRRVGADGVGNPRDYRPGSGLDRPRDQHGNRRRLRDGRAHPRPGLETLASDVLIQGAASSDWWSRQAQGSQIASPTKCAAAWRSAKANADLVAGPRQGRRNPASWTFPGRQRRTARARVGAGGGERRPRGDVSENDDMIASLQWHATLDTRTSIWCITRDGHHYATTTSTSQGRRAAVA
jgi:hypothetical protein